MTLYYLVIILSSVVYVYALVIPKNHVSAPSNNPAMESQLLIQTSAVLKVSYDGGHFFGWKATNDGMPISEEASDAVDWGSIPLYNKKRSRRNTRNKTVPKKPVVVRSVVGVLKKALAKIYGDVDSSRIQVEGSSRTDRGVHAHGMIAFIYCLTIDAVPEAGTDAENHDWRHRRVPETPHDSSHFLPLPFQGNMDKMVFVLNRMLPRDVCIMDVSTLPHVNNPITTHYIAPHLFHPSIDAISKTYQYTVSIGNMHDPLRCRHVWHVDDLEGNFNITHAQLCCQLFVGTHDFGAFRARDKDDSKDGDTIRTISMFQMNHSPCPSVSVVDGLLSPITTGATEGNVHRQKRTITYQVLVTGNRFMYKMVRILVGAVIAVGMGKETLESVHTALGSKTDENRYKFCAPAHGLALLNVSYPDNFIFSWSRR